MINVLLHELYKGLNHELKGNLFAKNLYRFLKANIIPSVDQLQGYVDSNLKTEEISEEIKESFNNYNFKKLEFSKIRKFPGRNLYEIRFTNEDGHTCSSVFLGSNSVGKTTIFHCLEKAALGSLFSVKNNNQFKEKLYLENNIKDNKDINITLYTENGCIHISPALEDNPVLTPSHFCSNNDVYDVIKNGITPHFIAEQLGLSKYEQLLTNMKDVRGFVDKHRAYLLELKEDFDYDKGLLVLLKKIKENTKDIKFVNTLLPFEKWYKAKERFLIDGRKSRLKKKDKKFIIDLWSKDIVPECLRHYSEDDKNSLRVILFPTSLQEKVEKMGTLNDEITQVFESINDTVVTLQYRLSRFLEIKKSVKSISAKFELLYDERIKMQSERGSEIVSMKTKYPILDSDNDMISNFFKTELYLVDKYKEALENFKKDSYDVMTILLKDYFNKDICDISILIDHDSSKLRFSIKTKDPITGEINNLHQPAPQEYLNTFRLKLFYLSLKMALAFYSQKINYITAPIVIDDIFDSSDFSNRKRIENFILKSFESHEKIFKQLYKNSENKYEPMQLIFFTQDDMIAESVFNAIKLYRNSRYGKVSRIFDVISIYDNKGGKKAESDTKSKRIRILGFGNNHDEAKDSSVLIENKISEINEQ